MTRRLSLLLAALGLACDPLPPVRHEGVHVRVAPDPGLELCGGTLAHMDDFVARVSAEFGVDPPLGDDRFTYYWLDPEDFGKRTPCPDAVAGCAVYDGVYSKVAPLDHELVHSVSFAYGVGPQIFVEGLARAYEGLEAWRSPQPQRPRDVWKFVSANWIAPLDYDVAGAFTSYLIARFGLDVFLSMYAGLGLVAREGAIDRAFKNTSRSTSRAPSTTSPPTAATACTSTPTPSSASAAPPRSRGTASTPPSSAASPASRRTR
ncbi:hypothetical protein OV079_11410 [Nannocystis pusilla]|uniref:Uncharacterized protein n=1 Tax=Nannocystis pusilla TaxID=889268 RepID=A0A9X3ELB3_9BACT|nr:hypothetical protein [Nannocystis pusilla]MCY1006158.1 hypothetical protein [Nannocystis pusilla]